MTADADISGVRIRIPWSQPSPALDSTRTCLSKSPPQALRPPRNRCPFPPRCQCLSPSPRRHRRRSRTSHRTSSVSRLQAGAASSPCYATLEDGRCWKCARYCYVSYPCPCLDSPARCGTAHRVVDVVISCQCRLPCLCITNHILVLVQSALLTVSFVSLSNNPDWWIHIYIPVSLKRRALLFRMAQLLPSVYATRVRTSTPTRRTSGLMSRADRQRHIRNTSTLYYTSPASAPGPQTTLYSDYWYPCVGWGSGGV